MSELYYRGAVDVAGSIARGEIDAAEVVRSQRERITAVNPAVNAVVALTDAEPEAALPGPLGGVPVTIKDAFDLAGTPTTWGNPEWTDAIAGTDAEVVTRLRAAGAVPTGKTNVALMLGDFGTSANPLHGVTRNPWRPERVAGGSSGGAAAAVASGMSYLDFGSDVVGSIRIPAAFCGVYGLKPTPELVPLNGFQPPGPPAPASLLDFMCALGPIARCAADIRAALRATAGPVAPENRALSYALPKPRHTTLTDFRVGVVLDDPGAAVTEPVGAVLSGVVDALAAHGVPVTEGWPAGVDPAAGGRAFGQLVGAYFAFKQGDATGGPDLATLFEAEGVRRKLRAAWDACFADIDVLLCPVTASTAPPHDERRLGERTIDGGRPYTDLAAWVPHASVAGLPALSAPVGTARDGLPVGLQIIGPRFEDDTVITFAELLAGITGPPREPLP